MTSPRAVGHEVPAVESDPMNIAVVVPVMKSGEKRRSGSSL